MPVDYLVDKLEISNFRGIETLELEISEKCLNILIGANNSGKSTILDAISLVLDGPISYNYSPDKHDFFCTANGTCAEQFELKIQFSAANDSNLPAVRGAYGNPKLVYGACVTGSVEKNERYTHRTRLLDEKGDFILLPGPLPLKGKTKEEWKEHGFSSRPRYARWLDIADYKPEVWLLKPDNLFVSLYQWKTGPLKKLAKLLARQFFDSKWSFDYKGKGQAMPETLHKAHEFFSSAIREFPFVGVPGKFCTR
jgi:energy-coupling factor transporter ATP-binding protein EcfA2